MNFRDLFSKRSIRQLLFVVVLFALLIPMAIWDSNTQIKVNFYDTSLNIRSEKYNMSVAYEEIASAELAELAEPGQRIADCFDNDIIRVGQWQNEIWGTYNICVDLDTSSCIVLHLTDGRIFVFSCKNDKSTAECFDELQTYLG